MKYFYKILAAITLPVILHGQLFSQIVIDQSDMPSPNDTIRISTTLTVPSGYAKTAMDTTWNFTMLEALNQRVDTFRAATATPSAYQLFFVLLGGANLASPRNVPPFPGLPVTNGYTFYKNSAASFSELGSAYTLQGAPIPAKYNNPDVVYQFPLTPALTWSSVAAFEMSLPGFGYLGMHRNRQNIVDGWGALATPWGTFQTLRVKSVVTEHDSIYLDTLSMGFPVDSNVIEYKWLAKGKDLPVLQINEEPTLTTAVYRDIYQMSAQQFSVSIGPDTSVFKGTILHITAAISGGTPPYQVFWSTLDTARTITLTVQQEQVVNVMVVDAMQNFSMAQKHIYLKFPPGIGENTNRDLLITPNPSDGKFRINSSGLPVTGRVTILSVIGTIVREPETVTEGSVIDLSDLPEGVYILQLNSNSKLFYQRLILKK